MGQNKTSVSIDSIIIVIAKMDKYLHVKYGNLLNSTIDKILFYGFLNDKKNLN